VRQRYPLRKEENERAVYRYMITNDKLLFLTRSSSKSFIDSSNLLEFTSRHIRYDGDVKTTTKKAILLIENCMIQQFDKLAELNKRVSLINTGEQNK
jgi:hypothetical protein